MRFCLISLNDRQYLNLKCLAWKLSSFLIFRSTWLSWIHYMQLTWKVRFLVSDLFPISGCSVKMAAVFHSNFLRIIKPVSVRILRQTSRLLSESATKVAAFDEPRVQVLLKRITGRNLDKVLASRRESGVGLPSYGLMTDEELSLVCIIKNCPIIT